MDSPIDDKSFEFAVRIVKLCRYINNEKHEYNLSKQLLKSGTSIGANVREARHGQSGKDFISKMSIALKEANESIYWIELFGATDILDNKQKESIWNDCNELISILVTIVKTAKKNIGENEK